VSTLAGTRRRRDGTLRSRLKPHGNKLSVPLAAAEIPGMLWFSDASGRRTFSSDQWLEFTGRTAAQERGQGWLGGVPADDRRRYLQVYRNAAARRERVRIGYHLRRFDGETRWVFEEARPRLGPKGRLLGFVGLCVDADTVSRAEPADKETDALRSVSGRLEAAREGERSRLARELHDELGQVLTSTKLDLMWLCDHARQPGARPSLSLVNKLQSLAGLIELAIVAVQRITTELKPPAIEHLGLAAALEWEATKFQARTGIRCRVASRLGTTALDGARATTLFRIAQESLTNVARHAHAGAVRLSIRRSRNRVVLDVHDNGRGISARELRDPESAGLLGMRERAHLLGGELKISGIPGRGTRITVSIPCT
jgi:two-component system, NarL family, sensor histidine kinase UhpB